MLGGEKELIAHGAIRYVYLVQHGERKLVVKAIQAKFEQLKGTKQANQKHRREATVSDAVRHFLLSCRRQAVGYLVSLLPSFYVGTELVVMTETCSTQQQGARRAFPLLRRAVSCKNLGTRSIGRAAVRVRARTWV